MNQYFLKKDCKELHAFPHLIEFAFKKISAIQFDSFKKEVSAFLRFYYVLEGRFDWMIEGQHHILYPGDLAIILQAIKAKEADFTKEAPSRIDESNPYMIYRGWHRAFGYPDAAEWAIERIRREGDEIIHEWAFGTQKQIYKWNDRLDMNYVPYDHDLPVEMPLPPAEGPGPQEPIEPQQPME